MAMNPPNMNAVPASKPSLSEKINAHKGLVIGGAVAVGGILYLFMRRSSSSSASSTGTTSTPTVVYPQSGTGGAGSSPAASAMYAGLMSGIYGNNQALSSQLSSLQTAFQQYIDGQQGAGNPSGKPSGGGQPTQAQNPALRTQTIGGKEYYVLGSLGTNGQYTGYNVTGGAPVYATWTGQGTPVQGFSLKNIQPGEVLYTPTSTPNSQIGNYKTEML